jgi:DamX protein
MNLEAMMDSEVRQAMGLQRDPFSAKDDLDLCYVHPGLTQRLNLLTNLVRGGDFLILVLGERGSGKTMLRNLFLDSVDLPLAWRRCRMRQRLTGSSGRFTRLGKLHKHRAHLLPEKPHPTIMIDDAHQLGRDELKQLLKAPLTPDASFGSKRLILFCEPSLGPTIEILYDELGIQTPISRIHLPPIKKGQTGEYLQHRLRVCGYQGNLPFGKAAIKAIHENSMGIPADINRLARAYLANRFGKGWFPVPRMNFIRSRSIGGIAESTWLLLALLLVAVFLFFDSSPTNWTWQFSQLFRKEQGVLSASVDRRFAVPAIDAVGSPSPPVHHFAAFDSMPTEQFVPLEFAPEPEKERFDRPKKDLQESLPLSAEPEPFTIHDQTWLLAQNPKSLTIQIVGVRKKSSLVGLIKRHRLDLRHKVAFLETNLKGKPWYQGFYGLFNTRPEALTALEGLPPEILESAPFIVGLAIIQQRIKRGFRPQQQPQDSAVLVAFAKPVQ